VNLYSYIVEQDARRQKPNDYHNYNYYYYYYFTAKLFFVL